MFDGWTVSAYEALPPNTIKSPFAMQTYTAEFSVTVEFSLRSSGAYDPQAQLTGRLTK